MFGDLHFTSQTMRCSQDKLLAYQGSSAQPLNVVLFPITNDGLKNFHKTKNNITDSLKFLRGNIF